MVDENAVKRFFNVNKLSVTDISKKVGIPEDHVSAILAGEEYVPEEVEEVAVDADVSTDDVPVDSEDESTDAPEDSDAPAEDAELKDEAVDAEPEENVVDEEESTSD